MHSCAGQDTKKGKRVEREKRRNIRKLRRYGKNENKAEETRSRMNSRERTSVI
jgi:hypothetical protein